MRISAHVNRLTKMERGWHVEQGLAGNDDVDVMPVNDLREHIPGTHCPCKPTIEIVGANLVIIHNSWDGRELIEQIEDWLCK